MTMTSPAVIELPRLLEPVSRDTFLDEPEERVEPGVKIALTPRRLDEISPALRTSRTRSRGRIQSDAESSVGSGPART